MFYKWQTRWTLIISFSINFYFSQQLFSKNRKCFSLMYRDWFRIRVCTLVDDILGVVHSLFDFIYQTSNVEPVLSGKYEILVLIHLLTEFQLRELLAPFTHAISRVCPQNDLIQLRIHCRCLVHNEMNIMKKRKPILKWKIRDRKEMLILFDYFTIVKYKLFIRITVSNWLIVETYLIDDFFINN